MNDFMRPALYGATHPIRTPRAVVPELSSGSTSLARCVNPAIVSSRTGSWRSRPTNDLLVLGEPSVGFVEASNYNSRPRPANAHQRPAVSG